MVTYFCQLIYLTQIHKMPNKFLLTHRQKENFCKHGNSFNIKFSKTQLSRGAIHSKFADNITKTVVHSTSKCFTTVGMKSSSVRSRFKDVK